MKRRLGWRGERFSWLRGLRARAAVFVPPRLRRLVTRASGSPSPGAPARRTREERTGASSCSL